MRFAPRTLCCLTLAALLCACRGERAPPNDATAPAAASPAASPAAATAAKTDAAPGVHAMVLDGEFEIAGFSPGEAWIALRFDEVALSMENERTIRVKGRGTSIVDASAERLTAINVEAGTADATRIAEACGGGCTLDGVIAEDEPNAWYLKTLRGATPRPATAALDVGRDDPRRKLLLDALRPQIEADLGQRLIFEVDTLREANGSAFVVVRPRTPAGAPVDFANTRHAQRLEDGVLDGDAVYAIVQHRDGRWQVREYAVAPTDVAWAGWAEAYGAPASIFSGPAAGD